MDKLSRKMFLECLEFRQMLSLSAGLPETASDIMPSESVAVEITQVEGLRAATLELSFDQDLFEIDTGSIRAGSVWGQRGMVVTRVNSEEGKIHAFVFSTQELTDVSGSLLEFDVVSRIGDSTDIPPAEFKLKHLSLNEGNIDILAPVTDESREIASATVNYSRESEIPNKYREGSEDRIQSIPLSHSQTLDDRFEKIEDRLTPGQQFKGAVEPKHSDARRQPERSFDQNEPRLRHPKLTSVASESPVDIRVFSPPTITESFQTPKQIDNAIVQLTEHERTVHSPVTPADSHAGSQELSGSHIPMITELDSQLISLEVEAPESVQLDSDSEIAPELFSRSASGTQLEFNSAWQAAIPLLESNEPTTLNETNRIILAELPPISERSDRAVPRAAPLVKTRHSSGYHLSSWLPCIIREFDFQTTIVAE